MIEITARQQQVLDVIHAYIDSHGYPPTIRELGAALGVGSTNAVTDHLRALIRKGFIDTDPGKSRGIVVRGRARIEEVDPVSVGVSRSGARFVFVEPQRDRRTNHVYFPYTPRVIPGAT